MNPPGDPTRNVIEVKGEWSEPSLTCSNIRSRNIVASVDNAMKSTQEHIGMNYLKRHKEKFDVYRKSPSSVGKQIEIGILIMIARRI